MLKKNIAVNTLTPSSQLLKLFGETGTLNYLLSIKDIVNPQNQPLTGIYGGAGADLSSYLIATNATNNFFINNDVYTFNPGDFKSNFCEPYLHEYYVRAKAKRGFSTTNQIETEQNMVLAIIQELYLLGVSANDVTCTITNQHFKLSFLWQHPTAQKKQNYNIYFFETDITQPNKYPATLQNKLAQGIDLYFQKAGLSIPNKYRDFLPYLAKTLNKQTGYFITDDLGLNTNRNEQNNSPYCQFEFPKEINHKLITEDIAYKNQQQAILKKNFPEDSADSSLYGRWLNIRKYQSPN